MLRSLKYILPLAAAVLFVVAVAHVVRSNAPQEEAPPLLVEPPRAPFRESVAGAGIVESRTENIAIGAPLPGLVKEVFAKVGQQVRAGDELFTLDDRQLLAERDWRQAALNSAQAELEQMKNRPRPEEVPVAEAKLRQAEAALTERERTFARAQQLYKKSAIAQADFDQAEMGAATAKATRDQAKAELDLLQAGSWKYEIGVAQAAVERARSEVEMTSTELSRLVVRATIDGEVLQVNVRPGEFVGAIQGTPLVILGNTVQLHVRVDIDEQDILRFRPGAEAVASVKGHPQVTFPLKFVRVEPYVVPKRSLTGENTERIDTRVLQVIYAIDPGRTPLYVGQQMDAFISAAGGEKVAGD